MNPLREPSRQAPPSVGVLAMDALLRTLCGLRESVEASILQAHALRQQFIDANADAAPAPPAPPAPPVRPPPPPTFGS